jgi:hypothetical protein
VEPGFDLRSSCARGVDDENTEVSAGNMYDGSSDLMVAFTGRIYSAEDRRPLARLC